MNEAGDPRPRNGLLRRFVRWLRPAGPPRAGAPAGRGGTTAPDPVAAALRAVPIADLPAFDVAWRESGARCSPTAGGDPVAATATALMHPDGRVREGAVGRAAERITAAASSAEADLLLGLLLIRRNDWVAPVAAAAAAATARLLETLPPESWLRTAALLPWLGRAGRVPQQPFVGRVAERLARPDARAAVLALLGSGPVRLARALVAALATAPAPDPALLDPATRHPHAGVRLAAARRIGATAPAGDVERLVLRLAHDPSPLLRNAALRIAWSRLPDLRGARAEAALTDRARLVRSAARAMLPRAAVAARARALADDDGTDLLAALEHLAATGERDDALRAGRWLDHDRPRVRAAAIAAVAALAPDPYGPDVRAAVTDAAPCVARAAARALLSGAVPTDGAAVADALRRPQPPYATRLLLALLVRADRAAALAELVRLRAAAGPTWADARLRALLSRGSGHGGRPRAAAARALSAALERHGDALPGALRRQLAWIAELDRGTCG